MFRAVVVANNVQKLSRDAQGPTFSEEDYDNIMVGSFGSSVSFELAPLGRQVVPARLVQVCVCGVRSSRCFACCAALCRTWRVRAT